MNIAIVNCFDTYEHRVELLCDYFSSEGHIVQVYTSDFRHIEKVKRTDKKEGVTYIDSTPYYKNISPQRLYSHYNLAKDIFSILRMQNIDLLWVLIPPNSFVKEAKKYKEQFPKVKLIFDVIDMWPETMPVEKIKNLYPVKLWKNLRDDGINAADHVVTECNLFQEKLCRVVNQEKMTTIYLAREEKKFQSSPDLSEEKISLCYLGSINNIIDISTIEAIIKTLREIKPVDLHIIGDGEKLNELVSVSKIAGAEVIYHGKIYSKDEKLKIFDKCHYGLNIMKESVYVGLTMKSLDYFEAGLPIINNIKGDTWGHVDEYNLGVNINKLSENLDFSTLKQRKNARLFFENNLTVDCFFEGIRRVMCNVID